MVSSRLLELLEDSGLLQGKTLGVDVTKLEANAATRPATRNGWWRWPDEVDKFQMWLSRGTSSRAEGRS